MRTHLKFLANIVGLLWVVIPIRLSNFLIKLILVLSTRHGSPKRALIALLDTRDTVDLLINERSMAYGDGEHPKHRLTKYHEFFIDHIVNGENVLDLGCGYGAVARSIAAAHSKSKVLGVDYCDKSIEQANNGINSDNLSFILSDINDGVPDGRWQVVVLSNVLEHLHNRSEFLKSLSKKLKNPRFLIRVPLYERDWQIALRNELGVDFRSDPDHKIEHKVREFQQEIHASGLSVVELNTIWGEIWAVCHDA